MGIVSMVPVPLPGVRQLDSCGGRQGVWPERESLLGSPCGDEGWGKAKAEP
jgi:hypothetical protein